LNPRIARLPYRQHPPQPVTVPWRYLRTRPPDPAPAISVVTPSLNQRNFLEQTLRSVLSQGYPNLEYIVQDGGSTDGSCELLDGYREVLTHCVSEPDGGHANAINRGMAHATGEILAYLNSDDLYLPGALAAVARFFERHPGVGLVHGNRIFIDEDDQLVGVWVTPPHDDELLRWTDWVAQETMFWRRSAWERVGGYFDESIGLSLDWEFLLRLSDAGVKMVHISRFLGAFRVHPEQKTGAEPEREKAEAAELHRRYLGRAHSWEEVMSRAKPFLRGHTWRHNLHRAGQRLPVPRVEVDYRSDRWPLHAAARSARAAVDGFP
jgi:glycosyltransferase involved in cell wall biosynthesis